MVKELLTQKEEDFREQTAPEQKEGGSGLRRILNQAGERIDNKEIPKSLNLNDLLSTNYNNTQME